MDGLLKLDLLYTFEKVSEGVEPGESYDSVERSKFAKGMLETVLDHSREVQLKYGSVDSVKSLLDEIEFASGQLLMFLHNVEHGVSLHFDWRTARVFCSYLRERALELQRVVKELSE